jgi:hypothetical protein
LGSRSSACHVRFARMLGPPESSLLNSAK